MRLFQILRCSSKFPKDYSNFPQSYIERAMEQIEWKTPKGPQYQDKVIKREKFYYGMHRPWTQEFYEENKPNKKVKEVFVEPIRRWSFFRGDRVEILCGKDKGKHGIVNYIVKERNWVTVEGLNCLPMPKGPIAPIQRSESVSTVPLKKLITKDFKYIGGRGMSKVMIKNELPLRITDQVALIDPSDNKSTKIEWRYTEDGEEVRVSLRTGRIIPIPKMAEETYDYKEKRLYNEQAKDTKASEIEKITFAPKLSTFEQEIMENIDMQDNRVAYPTYWY